MDPLTLIITTVAGAGFIWKSLTRPKQSRPEAAQERPAAPKAPEVDRSGRGRKAEFDISQVEVLEEYRVVRELIDMNFPLIFVTGSAGTGKSTFIRWLRHVYKDQVLIAAPTGMASINIDGQTIHRLCHLPPTFLLKSDIKEDRRREDVRNAKVLILDEVSMVTSNMLDAVSMFFKVNRGNSKPFGGVPVIMVGDLFQLPPIVDNIVAKLFDHFYRSPKFYDAKTLDGLAYYAVELRKTFRQSDQHFVDLLAKIRTGRDLDSVLEIFNGACTITQVPPEGAVHLSPRNREVDRVNRLRMADLPGPEQKYIGQITGDFKRDRLPSPIRLELRRGAQVMFTKNGAGLGWVNGSVGIVKALREDSVEVTLEDGARVIVEAEEWESFDYEWNATSRKIERKVTGRYRQLPLMLGWAITIHKSQGKTIDRVHLDLGAGAFETGQTYVALSRCRSLAGLTMSRALRQSDIRVDESARAFDDRLQEMISKVPPSVMRENITRSSAQNPDAKEAAAQPG